MRQSAKHNKSIRKNTTAIALISALGLAACSSSTVETGELGPSPSPLPAPAPAPAPAPVGTTFAMTGAASKGVILGGAVRVIDPSAPGTPILTGTTSATDGLYTLSLPDTQSVSSPLLKVTVSGQTGALMICDIAEGCGDAISFGDTFPIGPGVSISAIVPTPQTGITDTVNVTALTDLAAQLVEARADNAPLSLELVVQANSQVADLFGLTGEDLADLPVFDITSDDAANFDANVLRAAFINAGVMSSAFENNADLGVALANLVDAFVEQDGQLVVNELTDSGSIFSLRDILEGANDAIQAAGITGEALEEVAASLAGDVESAAATAAGVITKARPSPTAGATPLAQAKAFIADFQLAKAAIENDQTVSSIEDYIDRVEAAAELLEVDAEDALASLGEALEAAVEAFNANRNDGAVGAFTSKQGLPVTIEQSLAGVALTITDAQINRETVTLSVLIDDQTTPIRQTENGLAPILTDLAQGDVTITFSGMIENAALELAIADGELLVNDLDVVSARGALANLDIAESEFTIADLAISMNVELESLTEQSDLTFDGRLSLDVTSLESASTLVLLTDPSDDDLISFTAKAEDIGAEIATTRAALSGEVSEGGQSLDITLAIDIQGEELVSVQQTEGRTWIDRSFNANTGVLTEDFPLLSESYGGQAEFVTITEFLTFRSEFTDNGGDLVDANNTVRARYVITDESAPVFKYTQFNPAFEGGEFTWFAQADGLNTVFQTTPSGVALPEEATAIDYLNEGLRLDLDEASLVCADDELLIVEPAFIGPVGIDTEAFVIAPEYSCETFALQRDASQLLDGFFKAFTGDGEGADLAAKGTFATSARQDFAGIDPQDPEVEIALFGAFIERDDEVGEQRVGRIRLSFAGRKFETNAAAFGFLDAPEGAIWIQNQDNVIVNYIEDEETGAIIGNISKDGAVLGNIEETGNGILTVTYTDGSFVTIL